MEKQSYGFQKAQKSKSTMGGKGANLAEMTNLVCLFPRDLSSLRLFA